MLWKPMRSLSRARSGNIGISAALAMPLVITSMALAIDYGYLTVQKREMQSSVDLAAIAAAANVSAAEKAVLNHFANNGLNYGVSTPNGLLTIDGKTLPPGDISTAKLDGVATVTRGRYVPDPSVDAGQRFIKDATPTDAVQVMLERKGDIFLASIFSAPPDLSVYGTAASSKIAAFSVGSRLASLNDGLLNSILGQMLGTTISLKIMDYQALIDADIDIQPFLKIIATRLNLTAASYEDVLKANLTMPQLLASMRLVQGLSGTVTAALKSIELSTSNDKRTFTLAQILNLDPKKSLQVDAGSDWAMRVSALQIVSAAAAIANGENQIALNAVAGLPGIASAKVKLAIGEPPVETPSHRLGTPGAAIRTAQTRLAVEVNVDGLAALAGIRIRLPIYVELAYAEAKLADIRCYGGTPENASVSVDAVPGIAEIAIGDVDPAVLSNFSSDARVQRAKLVDALVVKIDALAHVEAQNLKPTRLSFSPSEVAARSIKTVSTKDILTSTTQTLLNNLDLNIQVLFLTLGSPTIVQQALAQTLGAVTKPVDDLLYNLLLLVGVRVGEADVRVTGVKCQSPVLVQ
ncbi:TadG family pilus assembly protein [Ensifer adhaerens]|uniref:TadG family pilus assembly protein n=1 Tax=Ensifer adhaerens TaxID=106592 RepID=UPI001CF062E6|nr:TadG family pilus assembly protein [Ensifer adhaerens]UCM21537.1 pilus assembly protein TadG-related protein [Ensifer adhaerens]